MRFHLLFVLLSTPLYLFGCSEYKLESNEDPSGAADTDEAPNDPADTADPLAPDAVATPESIDLGVICDVGANAVSLHNEGQGDLVVSAITVSDSSWSLEHDALPLTLASGESMEVSLATTGGEATLSFETNDPDTPTLDVPLASSPDSAPDVTITTPTDGETLDPGASTTFYADLTDDADTPEEVSVEWSSDVDGVLSNNMPDSDGTAWFIWDANSYTIGTHSVTLTATDTCGNTASDTVNFCQNEGYMEENLDLSTWNFEGTANWDSTNGWVELTNTGTDQAGTAFQTAATVDADAVTIAFNFYVSGGSGADGISLTALDTTRMSGFVGDTGGGIGYGGLPGWSVEIDTWYNSEHSDPTSEDHLSVHIDGDVNNARAWSALPDMEDNNWHSAEVTVSGTWMTITIDGTTYIDQDVSGINNFPAYVGFTGATGSATNYHLIDSLQVEGFACDEKKQ